MPPEQARTHARAVFTTLREAVGDEFYDVTVQRPPGTRCYGPAP